MATKLVKITGFLAVAFMVWSVFAIYDISVGSGVLRRRNVVPPPIGIETQAKYRNGMTGLMATPITTTDHESMNNLTGKRSLLSAILKTKSLVDTVDLVTSGKQFTGNKVRLFPNESRWYSQTAWNATNNRKCKITKKELCSKWGVVTTINEPTEAVRRFLYRKDWCVVIVGDKGLPKSFYYNTTLGQNVFFLSDELQAKASDDFVKFLPWNSFGRKNIGYLYAIAKGARTIFDFDDDNILKFWMRGASPDASLEIDTFDSPESMKASSCSILKPDVGLSQLSESVIQPFNPYPLLRSPDQEAWPRGYPLSSILKQFSWSNLTKVTFNNDEVRIGVLQSLADIQPDVDAIYRLTRRTPFVFQRPEGQKLKSNGVAGEPRASGEAIYLPSKEFASPYNAQATLHWYDAFWGLYLPVTVPGRVSDIWRSYFEQTVFGLLDMGVAFLPRPLVVQERNPHDIMGDFVAEQDLYMKSKALLEQMSQFAKSNDWSSFHSLEDAIESVYITFYEREFIRIEDVHHIQRWIQALQTVGYKFPKLGPHKGEQEEEVQRVVNCQDPFIGLHMESVADRVRRENELLSKDEPPACPVSRVRFTTADLHPGVMDDITATLSHAKQSILRMERNKNSHRSPGIINLPGVSLSNKLSEEVSNYSMSQKALKKEWPIENFNYYSKKQHDTDVIETEAFVCAFPASMCQLWREFLNATIVFIPAIRYNHGRCGEFDWQELNDWLKHSVTKLQGNTVGATTRHGMEYMKYYTGLRPLLAPILLQDSASVKTHYNASSRMEVLVLHPNPKYGTEVIKALQPNISAVLSQNLTIDTAQLGQKYKAIVMMTMPEDNNPSNFYNGLDFYSSTIPLFFPSPRFFLQQEGLNATGGNPQCYNISRELTLNRKTVDEGFSSHIYSPNLKFKEDVEATMYWLQFFDFYDLPYVVLFDSIKQLRKLLLQAKFQEIHHAMQDEMGLIQRHVSRTWCDIATRVRRVNKSG